MKAETKESILLINERDQVILENRKLKDVNKELLEALKNCAECMNIYKDDMIPISDHKAFWLFLEQAKKAIKKAE